MGSFGIFTSTIGNYDYKPFPDARAFGGELQHLGQAEGFYLGQLGKGSAPAAPKGDTSKAATINGNGPSMTGLVLLFQAMIHTAHTRGYGEVYLRNKGVVPPTYAV